MTGPDARKPFGRGVSSDLDREARKLRRQGFGKEAGQFAAQAAAQRVAEYEKFGTNMPSSEERGQMRIAENEQARQDAEQKNRLANAMIGFYEGRVGATGQQSPTGQEPTGVPGGATVTGKLMTTEQTGFKSDLANRAAQELYGGDLSVDMEKRGSDINFRKGLDRSIGMAKTTKEIDELRQVGQAAGISDEAFNKRVSFWNQQRR
jgi:hypothetical protein